MTRQAVAGLSGLFADSIVHTLELFYADIEQSGAALTFGVNTAGVSGALPVPEPASLVLLGVGLAGLGAVRRCRR